MLNKNVTGTWKTFAEEREEECLENLRRALGI